jgi:hypothetical protein
MKNYVVDVDITMSKTIVIEAENGQQAKAIVYSMIKDNPYDYTHGFSHYVNHEIVEANEVED